MNVMNLLAKRACFVIILACLLLSACAPKPAVKGVEVARSPEAAVASVSTDTPQPTHTLPPTPTFTLTPTVTPTLEPTLTSTPKPTATRRPDRTATAKAAEAALVKELLQRIEPDIIKYGYTLDDGHLIWWNGDPVELTVRDYGTSTYEELDTPVVDNFIIQTSITWNTTGGLAGCGLFFRIGDDISTDPSNQFVMYRLQSAPAWDISFYDNGLWQRSLTKWVFAKSIIDKNDSTNVVALVVNGRNIYPYINGTKQRLVEDITLKEGTFAFTASQESGVSTCSFADTWIWVIDKK